MKTHTIKHIHARIGTFNGSVYFVVDDRLLRIGIGTPNFNGYGEWRLSDWCLSIDPYDPLGDSNVLVPYDIDDIVISEEDLKFLEMGSKILDYNDGCTDEERDEFFKLYPDVDFDLRAGRFEEDSCLTFFKEDGSRVKYDEWVLWNKINQATTFEKIFFPIISSVRENYIDN